MGKKWDSQKNFYDWCKLRAEELYRVIKSGGYVLIFGHHKSNHRMKCAFEDVGFNIVEEIDWVYGSGFPKNQDISKMFNKNNDDELSEKYEGWKTSGLKPAKEIITVFQKSLEGKYLDNIKKYGCGAMNIDVCRVPTSQEDKDMINAKASKNPTSNYNDKEYKKYGDYEKNIATPANELGRFPSNIIFDDGMGRVLDKQSGITQSDNPNRKPRKKFATTEYSFGNGIKEGFITKGFADEGGASRYFLNVNYDTEDFVPFLYCSKPTKKEKGENNIHVTVKPKKLIKWLIKLVTPKDGYTLDITSGSGTHGLCCEELNKEEGYNLKWLNIEMLNTEKEPYCEIAKNRVDTYLKNNLLNLSF